jgi:hypothetical protein
LTGSTSTRLTSGPPPQPQFYVELNLIDTVQAERLNQSSLTETQNDRNVGPSSVGATCPSPDRIARQLNRNEVQSAIDPTPRMRPEERRLRSDSINLRRRAMSIESLFDLPLTSKSAKIVTKDDPVNFAELAESLRKLQQQLCDLCEKPLLKQQEQLIELKLNIRFCKS